MLERGLKIIRALGHLSGSVECATLGLVLAQVMISWVPGWGPGALHSAGSLLEDSLPLSLPPLMLSLCVCVSLSQINK